VANVGKRNNHVSFTGFGDEFFESKFLYNHFYDRKGGSSMYSRNITSGCLRLHYSAVSEVPSALYKTGASGNRRYCTTYDLCVSLLNTL
jgi:hypothetical protein